MSEESDHRHHRLLLFSSVVYLLGVSVVMLRHNIWFSPDQFFIFALVAAVFLGRGKKFIRDWTPVILVFLSYEFFRGALPLLVHFPIHSTDIITAEKNLFGFLPTIELQKHLFNPANFQWYDYLATLAYMSFWICPLMFAFYLWVRHHALFKFASLAFFVLSYMGFLTYWLYPAMPPWMAFEKGFLPHMFRIIYLTTGNLTTSGSFPTLFSIFAPNEVAAMPSLHAALPTLLFIVALRSKKLLLMIVTGAYALLVYFSVVYLGEHYAIDAAVGMFYAILAYFLSFYAMGKFHLFYARETYQLSLI